MNGGRIGGDQVLPATLVAKLSHANVPIPGSDASYSYGLQVGKFRGVDLVSHAGSRSGYGSLIRMAPRERFGVIIVPCSGASLNRTADKAMELLLPLQPATHETDSAPKAMTAAEMADLAGTYSQSTRTMSIVQRDGRLFLARSNGETPAKKVGANRFRAAESRLVTVADAAGKVDYIHTGGRSWKKVS